MGALLEFVEEYGLTDRARDAPTKEARKQGQNEEATLQDPRATFAAD